MKYHFLPTRMTYNEKKKRKIRDGEYTEKLESLYIVEKIEKYDSHFGKQVVPQIVNIEISYDPAIPFLCMSPRKIKIYIQIRPVYGCSKHHYS